MILHNGPYTIYILHNTVNNKLYVGTTSRKLYQRFNNGLGYQHQKNIYDDICKYGWNKFNHKVFASNLSKEEAFNIEQIIIAKLREQIGDMLYNRDAGGEHGKHCVETKETLKQLNVGRIVSEEVRKKIKEARAKQVFSSEALAKRSAKMRGRKLPEKQRIKLIEAKKKKVKCLENNTVYSSATEAAKALNVSLSGISQVCNNKIPSVKNLHFQYV